MSQAAKLAGADFYRSWENYGSITHADWRNDYKTSWPPKNNSSLEVSSTSSSNSEQTSTTTTTTEPTIPETPSTSETTMHPCSVHETTVTGDHSWITPACGDSAHAGYACQISSDHKTTIPGWSGPFYECQPHTDYPCGHTDPTANAAYHAPQTSCTQTNANGQSCTVTNFYDCDQHTHVYPAPTISCGRSACSQTVSSSTQHSATCASGHSYWTCKPSDAHLHKTRTCIRSGCGQSWLLCTSVKPNCLVNSAWKCRAQ